MVLNTEQSLNPNDLPTHSQAVATDGFFYKARNSYFNRRVLFKIDNSFINSEYVTAYQEGQFEQCLKLTSLLVIGSCLVFLVLSDYSLFFKTIHNQQ